MKSKMVELENVKLGRYIQGLRLNIQDELSLYSANTVQKCLQLVLKVEGKPKRRQDLSGRGRGQKDFNNKGRGTSNGSGWNNRQFGDRNQERNQVEGSSRGSSTGRR